MNKKEQDYWMNVLMGTVGILAVVLQILYIAVKWIFIIVAYPLHLLGKYVVEPIIDWLSEYIKE